MKTHEQIEQEAAMRWAELAQKLWAMSDKNRRAALENLLEAENYYHEALEHGVFGSGTATYTLRELTNMLNTDREEAIKTFLSQIR